MAKKPKLTQAYRKRRQFAASAVRNYNAAVTRIEKQFGKSYAPPRRSVDELMKNYPSMKALRSEVKQMKKIPSPKNLEIVRVKDVLTSTYAISETARLNQRRNEKRRKRAEKYGRFVEGRSGWTPSQEKSLQEPVPFDEARFNDPNQWSRFKRNLMIDLSKERNVDSYYQNYLNGIEDDLGPEIRGVVEEALGDISPEEFYQLALTEDYRDVFTIEFIIYMPISAEQKIQELLWGIEQVKSYV